MAWTKLGVVLNSKMQHHQVTGSIVDLPDEVLATVMVALTSHAHGNPGDVCRLMLVRTAANPIFAVSRHYIKAFHSELPKTESVHARNGALLATELREAGLGVWHAVFLLASWIRFSCTLFACREQLKANAPVVSHFKSTFANYSRRMLLRWQVRLALILCTPVVAYDITVCWHGIKHSLHMSAQVSLQTSHPISRLHQPCCSANR